MMNATDIIIEDKSLPPSQTAQYIVEACDAAVAAASEGKTISETDDTPGLEDFLWTLWSNLLNQAQNSEEDQYRLVEIVGCLKRTKQQSSNWRIWGGETSWSELPLFGPVTRENLNGPGQTLGTLSDPAVQAVLAGETPNPSNEIHVKWAQARTQWLNLNEFYARIWDAEVFDLGLYGIWAERSGLEGGEENLGEPESLRIEVASLWISIAGRLMYQSNDSYTSTGAGGPLWKGTSGYSPVRWSFWKKRLEEIVASTKQRANAINAAKTALQKMSEIETTA